MNDEITSGSDILGALLMGHAYNSWWIGSDLTIEESRRLVPHQNATTMQVAFSPDAQWIAVGSEIGPVRVYNADTGALAAECAGGEGGTYTIVFRPDGKALTTAGFDGKIRIFDLTGKLEKSFVPVEVTE